MVAFLRNSWLLVVALLLLSNQCETTALRAPANREKWANNITQTHRHPIFHHHEEEQRDLQAFDHNPRFGKIKVLVLLIQFRDHKNKRNLVAKSVIQELWSGQISDWFKVNAQGLYEVEPFVTDWIQTENTEAYYADGQMGFTPDLAKAMYPALDQLDQDGFDFGPFDSNQDGKLDSVVMLHSGISALAGDPDCFGINGMMDRIWPHAWTNTLSYDTWYSQDESFRLNGYTVNSVFDGLCDDVPMTAGLTAHEYMHTMDSPDLYDATDLSSAKGVGMWDIMGHPYGADNSGTPGLLGAWMKEHIGWLDPILIEADGDYVSKPAHNNLQAYKIDLTQPGALEEEYLLIENRSPIGFEENIGGAGLLIWHIDDAADDMKNKGFPGQPGWPQNGNHYWIAVLPKDGNYDLEQNLNHGDAGDLFGLGDKLTPGNGGSVYPNTDSYQGGNIVPTGITIEVIEEDGSDFTFRVTGFGNQPTDSGNPGPPEPPEETPNPTPSPEETPNPTPSPTEPPATPAPVATPAETDAPTPEPPAEEETPAPVEVSAPTNSDTTTRPPSPGPGPATLPPVANTGVGAGNGGDRWILSRPPVPTRAPFSIPEFPFRKPGENNNIAVLGDSTMEESSATSIKSIWNGSLILGMALSLIGLLF